MSAIRPRGRVAKWRGNTSRRFGNAGQPPGSQRDPVARALPGGGTGRCPNDPGL